MQKRSYGKILSVNLKHNFKMPFVSALGVLILTLLLFNTTALQSKEAARPIEFLLCFTGVMLLVPVFYPEQDETIRDVIRSKKTDYTVVCIVRVLYSAAAMAALTAFMVLIMKWGECDVGMDHFWSGTADAWFLGAVGFTAAGLTNNITAGYMSTVLYYLANYGLRNELGPFYLVAMSYSGSSDTAGPKILGAVILMGVTLTLCRNRK